MIGIEKYVHKTYTHTVRTLLIQIYVCANGIYYLHQEKNLWSCRLFFNKNINKHRFPNAKEILKNNADTVAV